MLNHADFEDMRQLVFEYLACDVDSDLRRRYSPYPMLTILVKAYSYLSARYDLDGLWIDTAKYVSSTQLEWFGNAMRESGHSIGKRNIFTFGEICDNEKPLPTSWSQWHRALALTRRWLPLSYKLPWIAKAIAPVDGLRSLFADRIFHPHRVMTWPFVLTGSEEMQSAPEHGQLHWPRRSRADRALPQDHPLTRATCSRTGATGAGPPMRCRRCSGSPGRSIWCRSTAGRRQYRPG